MDAEDFSRFVHIELADYISDVFDVPSHRPTVLFRYGLSSVMITFMEGDELMPSVIRFSVPLVKEVDDKDSRSLMRYLLRKNNSLFFSKVGIDEYGDIWLRAYVHADIADSGQFRAVVSEVAASSAKLSARIVTRWGGHRVPAYEGSHEH
jgi:hypothetical protein